MSDTIVELAVGDYVECRYDGGDMWYEGKITAKHADGTYNVLYDDGDTEDFVPLMHLRLNEDAEPSDDEAYEQSNPTSSGGIDFAALKDTLSPEALAALAGHLNVDAGIEIKAPTEEEIAAKKAEHQRRLDEKARVLEETMKRLREQSTQEEQVIQDELGAPGIVASSPEEAVSALRSLGVVRLDGMVPANLCDELLAVINKKLDKSIESLSPEEMQPERGFGTILARKNRYDMYVRPDGLVGECLKQILTGGRGAAAVDAEAVPDGVDPSWNLAKFFKQVFDGQPDAKFSELSCIISDAGAPRQPLHPDTHWEDIPPIFSVFLALQDIDEAMGPTVFLPGTNNEASHQKFNADDVTKKAFLRSRSYKLSLLKKGDIAIFDARTLHCGGGNKARRRAQLMFSLENPNRVIDELTDTECRSCFKDLDLQVSNFVSLEQ